MVTHIQDTCRRAVIMEHKVRRLLPAKGGPRHVKSRIITTTVVQAALYGAPIWHSVLQHNKYKMMLNRITRRLSIMTIRAYRTASSVSVHVLAGIPPMELLVVERAEVYNAGGGPQARAEAKEALMIKWQRSWDSYEGWARTLVPSLRNWTGRKFGDLNHYLTQAFTGHGVFATYLCRIGKIINDSCWWCPGEADTPQHALFHCTFSEAKRIQAEIAMAEPINAVSAARLMLRDEHGWKVVAGFLENTMRRRADYEKRHLGNEPISM